MEIAIIVLGLIVLAQALERYVYAKDMNQKLADCIKAVMSRNIGDYLNAIKKDEPKTEEFVQSDEVSLSEASDSVFQKYINEQMKH